LITTSKEKRTVSARVLPNPSSNHFGVSKTFLVNFRNFAMPFCAARNGVAVRSIANGTLREAQEPRERLADLSV